MNSSTDLYAMKQINCMKSSRKKSKKGHESVYRAGHVLGEVESLKGPRKDRDDCVLSLCCTLFAGFGFWFHIQEIYLNFVLCIQDISV